MFASQFTPQHRQLHRQGGLFPTCCTYSPTDAKKIVAGCSLIEVLAWSHSKFIKLSTHFARLLRNMTARKLGSDGSVQLFFDKAGEEASRHPTRRFWLMCFELRNDVFIWFSILSCNNKIFSTQQYVYDLCLVFLQIRCAESLDWLSMFCFWPTGKI